MIEGYNNLDVSNYEFNKLTYTYETLDYFRNIYQKHLSAVVSDYCQSKPLPNLLLLSIYFYLFQAGWYKSGSDG